jgi:hypothetical protein
LSSGKDWTTLGDDVLARVMTAMVYGNKQPPSTSFQPLGGFAVSQAAESVAAVRNVPLHHVTSFNF